MSCGIICLLKYCHLLPAMIEVIALSKRFGDFLAVDNLGLSVPKGSIFGFLGPNGSGKSTTVRMLTGILKPSSGDALIDGSSILTSPL
jgi:ABC-type multidrug transport system ATPase subunit